MVREFPGNIMKDLTREGQLRSFVPVENGPSELSHSYQLGGTDLTPTAGPTNPEMLDMFAEI